jgi:hypothetical protein
MLSMEQPQYLINDIIKSTNNISELREKLFHYGIKTKEYITDDLILVYHNYTTSVKSELQRECRSLVLKMSTLEMLSYSCESPMLNTEGLDYLKYNNEKEMVKVCYEGSYLSLFYNLDRWYLATRKNLNTLENENISSKYNKMYSLFEDVVGSFELFTNKLDKDKSYYMVLLHHDNKHIIDYSSVFGNELYKKLVLISVKDNNLNEVFNDEYDFLNENIFIPQISDIDDFFSCNNTTSHTTTPITEGIIINKWDSKMNKFRLIKLQLNNYIYHSLLQNPNHVSLYLYQIGALSKRLGLMEIDTVFKLCSSEIFELFKLMWNINTGNKKENNIYNELSKEYKYIMYKVRGIFYSNKKSLKVSNVYALLKRLPISYLIALLKSRHIVNDTLDLPELQMQVYTNFIGKL